MRLLLSFFLIVSFTSPSFSQNNSKPNKKLFYGFNLGLNYTNIQEKNNSIDVLVQNNAGFSLGILGGYKISDAFSLVANSAVSFHDNELYSNESVYHFSDYTLLPTSIDFGLQAKINFIKNNSKSPYFILGPEIQVPTSQPHLSTEFGSSTNIALEFGLGCDVKFSEFTFAPEIRYSYGVNNINSNPSISQVNFHSIKLLLIFKN